MAIRTISEVGDAQFDRLMKIANEGLPPEYTSFEEFMFDFYPDFSWSQRMIPEIKHIIANPRFEELQLLILHKHKFDLKTDFDIALSIEGGPSPY